MPPPDRIDVYFEVGPKRTFAGAVEWPGWCRIGRDEPAALQALFDYGPRYAGVLQAAGVAFSAPADPAAFNVAERLEGSSATDFGAPNAVPSADARAVDEDELRRLLALLGACWQAFDAVVEAAGGRELRRGPRGGGRDLEGIVQHVIDADRAYLSVLGWKLKLGKDVDSAGALRLIREAVPQGLAASARGEILARGPRGGLRWTPRYFVRRSAWHVLDHAWEIEDRLL